MKLIPAYEVIKAVIKQDKSSTIFKIESANELLWTMIYGDLNHAIKIKLILYVKYSKCYRTYDKYFLKLEKPQSTAKDTDSEKPEQTGLSDDAKLRRANLNIEKWLKSKFREGFKDMLNAMKKYDNDDTGRINRKDFRHVLGQYGLHLR